MKTISTIVAAAALAAAVAAPVAAEQKAADPFVSTQGDTTALAIAGGMAALVLIVAATQTN